MFSKKTLLAILSGFCINSMAQVVQVSQDTMIEGSRANARTIESLHKTLMSIPSNDAKVNASELNKELSKLAMPMINLYGNDFKMYPTLMNTTFNSIVVGVQFDDGQNTFCLPCMEPGGWNSFIWGIIPQEKFDSYLFDQNKKKIQEMFGRCEYNVNDTSVGEMLETSESEKVISICKLSARCRKGVVSGITNISGSCVAVNGKCPNDPTDCLATRTVVTVLQGRDAIGDSDFPKRAVRGAEAPIKGVK